MKLGYFAPLPPARTGVADYADALLCALRPHADVAVNADGDSNLYQIGNNQLHRDIYRRAIERPGAVIVHDAVLHHFFLGSLDETAYVEEFVYNYGEWHREHARTLWAHRARSGVDPRYFARPMLRRVAERSKVVFVHNPAAAALVKAHCESARVVEIPHLYEAAPTPRGYLVERIRAAWGVPASAYLFGVFGHLRESKRLESILQAFGKLGEECWLLIAGDFVSSNLARSMADVFNQPRVIRVPHQDDFWPAAHAVDACVNLKYPAAGETSGIGIRLMGIGKPVIVTAGFEVSRYPEGACFRVDPGAAETAMLMDAMAYLSGCRADGREMGRIAAEHVRSLHEPDRVARLIVDSLADAPLE